MTQEHQNVCKEMTLVTFKPNEPIVKEGEPGDSFYYILNGMVKVITYKKVDIGLESQDTKFKIEVKRIYLKLKQYLGDLGPGQTFGELALIYGTPRAATVVPITNAALIRLDKHSFDTYVKDFFENQLKDQIEFMKLCPIFHRAPKEHLIKLAVRAEVKKYMTEQNIISAGIKTNYLYIVRRGNVKVYFMFINKVVKNISFIKDESPVKNKLNKNLKKMSSSFEDIKYFKDINNEKVLETLSNGPSQEDIEKGNIFNKDITLESLKMGDIFPAYYAANDKKLDVNYYADSPCDIIALKLNDFKQILKVIMIYYLLQGCFRFY
jgi:CRP-like cAMP-binding protein